jgi:thioredoxin reductase (NADPH)
LKNYSEQVTLLDTGSPTFHSAADPPSPADTERISIQLSQLRIDNAHVILCRANGERHFDAVYLALGSTSQHVLARSLGAICDEHGSLQVNAHQETTVQRLYAVGDVVRGLNQVIVAAAEGAVAATDLHNKLRAS